MRKFLFILAALLFTAGTAEANIVTTSNGSVVTTSGGNPVTSASPSRVSIVATASRIPDLLETTANFACMTRKAHYMRGSSTRLKTVDLNWYIAPTQLNNLGFELGPGNTVNVCNWIEYPVGTYTPVAFGGTSCASSLFSMADGSTNISDFVNVTVPNGALFYTWTYVKGNSGNNWPIYNDTSFINDVLNVPAGEKANCGTSGVPTSPGAMSDNVNGENGYWPVAILGDTTLPTFAFLGDSRLCGTSNVMDSTYDFGDIARSIGPTNAYLNLCTGGDRMATYFANHAKRDALINIVNPSAIVSQHGTNEFAGESATTAQWEAVAKNEMAHIYNAFPTIPIYRITMEPWTTSTDTFQTPLPPNWGVNCGNQTGTAYNANVTTENDHIRANTFDSIPFLEVADAVTTAHDSGCWKANGLNSFFTNGGGHATTAGDLLVQNSHNINPRVIAATAPLGSYAYPSLTLTGFTPASYVSGPFANTKGAVFASGNTLSPTVNGIIPGTPSATLACWIQIASLPGSQARPMTLGGQQAYINSSTGFIGVHTGNGTFTAGTTAFGTGAWHYVELDVVPTVGSTTAYTVYYDGTSAATFSFSTSAAQWTDVAGIAFGAANFVGDISECSLWNFPLHTSNFTNPTSPVAGNESGLVAVWHFNGDLTATRGPAGM